MRFGLVLTGVPAASCSADDQLRQVITLSTAAEDAGFDYLVVGQHFLGAPYRYLATIPLLARLAVETERIRLATGVLLLPLLRPVEVAEHLATLDVMSGGRLVCGFGLGYRDAEFDAFGVPRAERLARQVEALEVIEALWTGEPVSYAGQFVHLDGVTAGIVPAQRPRPPIWIAGMGEKSARRAVSSGYLPYLGPRMPIDVVAERVAHSHEMLGSESLVPVRRELYVSTEMDSWASAVEHIGKRFDLYRQWGLEQDIGGPEGSLADYLRDRVVAGSPEECLAALRRYDDVGVDIVVFRCHWPDLSAADVAAMVRLVGKEIIPAFH